MPPTVDELAVRRRYEHIEVSVVVGCQRQGHRSVAGISPQGWFDRLGQRISNGSIRPGAIAFDSNRESFAIGFDGQRDG